MKKEKAIDLNFKICVISGKTKKCRYSKDF